MTTTGLAAFDTTLQKTHAWINAVAAELGWDDKHRVFQGLRITLHTLRDRLTVDEAAHLGSQLPILLGGFYFEAWKPAQNPSKVRSQAEFFSPIRDYMGQFDPNIEVEPLVRAVFKVLAKNIPDGEIEDVVSILPADLKQLWPEAVRAR